MGKNKNILSLIFRPESFKGCKNDHFEKINYLHPSFMLHFIANSCLSKYINVVKSMSTKVGNSDY